MKLLKVRVIEEDRQHTNPERKYHLYDIERKKECISNLKKEEIKGYCDLLNLTIVE